MTHKLYDWEIVEVESRNYWPPDVPMPGSIAYERAEHRWKQDAEKDKTMSDFYFDFSFTIMGYSPLLWKHYFQHEH